MIEHYRHIRVQMEEEIKVRNNILIWNAYYFFIINVSFTALTKSFVFWNWFIYISKINQEKSRKIFIKLYLNYFLILLYL